MMLRANHRTALWATLFLTAAACAAPTSSDPRRLRDGVPAADDDGSDPAGRAAGSSGDSPPEDRPGIDATGNDAMGADPTGTDATEADASAPDAAPRPAKPNATLEKNIATAIAYGRTLIGTPYGWWYSGPLPAASPMWTATGAPPPSAKVTAAAANCTGLTNLMLRAVGKRLPTTPQAGTGGTGAYSAYYASVAKPFDPTASYPVGTLLGRRFRDSVDQGHVAVVIANGKVLQSFASSYGATGPGVNDTYTIAQSAVGRYYEYVVLPADWLAPAE